MSRRFSVLFTALVFLSMTAALYAVFLYVPTEREMGPAQHPFKRNLFWLAACERVLFPMKKETRDERQPPRPVGKWNVSFPNYPHWLRQG